MVNLEMFSVCVVFVIGLNQLSLVCSVNEYKYVSVANGWLRLHIAPAPWPDARLQCGSEGGILASPTTDVVVKAMTEIMAAYDFHHSSVFTGIHAKFWGDFVSLDGQPLANVSAPWAEGEPSGLANEKDCLVLTGAGELAAESCVSELPYFCFTTTASISKNKCGMDTGLNQLSLVCSVNEYKYVSVANGWLRLHIAPAPWPDARLQCGSEGGILASPTTDVVVKAMTEIMAAYDFHHSSVFTGIHAKFWGDFVSLDGQPLANVSAPWAEGEPSGLANEKDCLVLTGAGELAAESCVSELPYFCFTTTASISKNKCGMDTGYTMEPRTGSCYKFHCEGLPWHRAAMKCASERAYLAVIDSEEESQVLAELFARNPENSITGDYNHVAHVGFSDWNRKGEWLTVFGETLNQTGFETWDDGEPNHIDDQEFCGSVSRNGKLNDSPCVEKKMPYICEIMLK